MRRFAVLSVAARLGSNVIFIMNTELVVKTATKKALIQAAFYVVLMLVLLWLLAPLDGIYKIGLYTALVLFLGYCAIRDVKRSMYKMPCELCKEDIYPILITTKYNGASLKYCPYCGGKVEKI